MQQYKHTSEQHDILLCELEEVGDNPRLLAVAERIGDGYVRAPTPR